MLQILSWNVAGWATTVKQIVADYGGVGPYFDRHDVDIVCIQEVKSTEKRVEEDPQSVGANDDAWHAPDASLPVLRSHAWPVGTEHWSFVKCLTYLKPLL